MVELIHPLYCTVQLPGEAGYLQRPDQILRLPVPIAVAAPPSFCDLHTPPAPLQTLFHKCLLHAFSCRAAEYQEMCRVQIMKFFISCLDLVVLEQPMEQSSEAGKVSMACGSIVAWQRGPVTSLLVALFHSVCSSLRYKCLIRTGSRLAASAASECLATLSGVPALRAGENASPELGIVSSVLAQVATMLSLLVALSTAPAVSGWMALMLSSQPASHGLMELNSFLMSALHAVLLALGGVYSPLGGALVTP